MRLSSYSISLLTAWICGLITIGHSLFYHLCGATPVNVISWDVYGYYVYLPALFNYGDPVYYSFLSDHFSEYPIANEIYQVAEVEEGRMAPIYTIGLAVLWAPGYALANFVAWLSPAYEMDGLSAPYQWSILLTNWLFTLVGIFYLRKVLIKVVDETIAAWVLIFIFLGTNFYHYAVFENGMSHTYLLSLYAVLLYHTLKWHETPSYRSTFIIGLCVAFLCLARPSELVSILIPLLYGVYSRQTLHRKFRLVAQNWRMVLLLAFTGCSLVLIQILYWKLTIGTWVYNGYAGHHFDFLQPHLWEGLFSYRKGWLLYTPLMFLAILGFFPMMLFAKKWRLALLTYFVINIYIVLSWHIWWYASSFGMRALIQSYAVLAIPMAALLKTAFRYRMSKLTVLTFGIFCIALNHFQDWQYRNRILAMDQMTETFYRHAWGKTSFEADAYKYIDNNEQLPQELDGISETIVEYQAGKDGEYSSGEKLMKNHLAFVQPPEVTYSPSANHTLTQPEARNWAGKWLAVKGTLLYTGSDFDKYHAAKLVFSYEQEGKAEKWRGVRFQRYRPENEWLELTYHVQLPAPLTAGDQLKVYVWNTSPDTIYIQKLELGLITE